MIPSLFEYSDFREWIRVWVKHQPKEGYGQYRKMAGFLRVSTVTISQILKADRQLTMEQAFHLCSFIGLQGLEKEYFLLMVQKARSSDKNYESYVDDCLLKLKARANQLKERIRDTKDLDDAAKTTFYSDTHYSLIRLLTSIPEYQNPSAIAERLKLSLSKVGEILDFLVQEGLCESENGVFRMRTQRTHLSSDSPHFKNRQIKLRLKALYALEAASNESSLFFSSPVTVSKKSANQIRRSIIQFIEIFLEEVKHSDPEELICLNIDWFKM